MPEEDHRFKRLIIEEDERNVAKEEEEEEEEEEKITEDKVSQFKWDDVDDEEPEGKLLVVSQDSIQECCTILADHLLSIISGEHFSELDTSGMKFVIPIDPSMHVLLTNRFEEKWDLDSRLDMFMEVRELLAHEFSEDTEKRTILDAKIQEALPPTRRKKLVLTEVDLVDDAMVVDDESNMISIEIPLNFEAN